MMLSLYIEILKMRRIIQPKEWVIILDESLQVCSACPKNMLWGDRGCRDESLSHVK